MLKRVETMAAVLAILCAGILSGAVPFDYKFRPEVPRKIRIGSKPSLTLAAKGKPAFEIVTPLKGTHVAQFAAQEAAALLSKAFGVRIRPIPKPSGKVPAIIIGDPAAAARAGIDLKKLDRDGFCVRTVGKNVIIIGRDDPVKHPNSMHNFGDSGERASLFGTYDFLERFAGIRFYYPGELGTYIPRLTEWTLPEIDIYDRPDLVQRSHYASWPKGALPPELGKPFRNQHYCLRLRVQSWTWPCCHGLEKLGLKARFAKSHPEYFARSADGKSILDLTTVKGEHVCFSSPVRQEICKDALAFLSGRPAKERDVRPYARDRKIVEWHRQQDPKVPVFDITPDDGYFPCRCERCRKLFTPADRRDSSDKSLSNYMWRYYAEAANLVKDHGYVAAWVYWPTLQEPDFKLPENILFVMCPRGPWSCGNGEFFKKELARVEKWGKITGSRMRLWNYMIKYPHGIFRGIPSGAPRAVARYYKAAAPHICGAFSESGMEHFMFQHLNLYVYYKVLWDTGTDVEALLGEYYALMYGKAAPHMAAFDAILEKLWLGMVGSSVETPLGPQAVIPSDLEIWKNRYSDKRMAELAGLLEKARQAVPRDSMESKRIGLITREVWQPLLDAKNKYLAGQKLHRSWRLVAVKTDSPVTVDGKLDEAIWRKAVPAHLTRYQSKNGVNEVDTTVRMLYDDRNFYFGVECEEPDTDRMVVQKFPADDSRRWANATAELFIDPDGTRTNYYQLMIDASGGMTDYFWDRGAADVRWNSGAEVKTRLTPGKKWTLEVRLPRRSMKGDAAAVPVNFMRHRVRLNKESEIYVWNPFMDRLKACDKWGSAYLGADPNPNIITCGNFEVPVRGKRWIGPWYGVKVLTPDRKIWLTGGASMALAEGGNMSVTQRFKLKPETTYEVSYFLKLENVGVNNSGGVRARFDECGGNVHWLPRGFLRGTIPWTRVAMTVTTDRNCGKNRKGANTEYLSIVLTPKAGGRAWVDCVEIREVKK